MNPRHFRTATVSGATYSARDNFGFYSKNRIKIEIRVEGKDRLRIGLEVGIDTNRDRDRNKVGIRIG